MFTLTVEEASKKPNTTKSIESPNPVWNDLIFVETLEENIPKEGFDRLN